MLGSPPRHHRPEITPEDRVGILSQPSGITEYLVKHGSREIPHIGEQDENGNLNLAKPNFKVLKQVQLRLRGAKVAELVLKGWTRVKIAELLNVSTAAVRGDLDRISEEWKETRVGCFDLFVQHQSKCIDKDEVDLRSRLLELDETRNLDPIKKLDAVIRVYAHILRIMERRSKLLGLDKPSELRVTHTEVKHTIQSIIAVIVDEVHDPDQRERIGHRILNLVAVETGVESQTTETSSLAESVKAS